MSDLDDDDAAAGEYVLGTLDASERRDIEARRRTDGAIDAAITGWESRFAPLLDSIAEVEPPRTVYESIMARLFGSSIRGIEAADRDRQALRRSVRRWQSAFAGALAIAAALTVWIVAVQPGRPQQQFVAVLQRDANSPAVVLDIDVATRRLSIRPVAASNAADKSLELWLISGSGAPRSLGTVAPTGITRASLSGYDQATIAGATYAVTLEPAGGSPTGQPTSAPILSGRLIPEPR